MALSLEDLDRRVTTLEQGAERAKTIVCAVAEIVSESERRMRAEMKALTERVSRSERCMVDTLNDRFDQVMAALDRHGNLRRTDLASRGAGRV